MKVQFILHLFLATLVSGFFPKSSFHSRSPSADFCSSPPEPYANSEQVKLKLKTYLELIGDKIDKIVSKDVGGTVVNLVYRDAVIWSAGFGVKNMSDSGPDNVVKGDSVFRIGSITKVFTAMLMLLYRDMGAIPSLDADITDFLPELTIKNPFKQKRGITFNQLASHMSGLPRETPCPHIFKNGCDLSYDQIYTNLSKMELINPPGTWPQYSNLGVAVLGRTLEKLKGEKWEDMLNDMILKPLRMSSTGNKFTPDVMKQLAVGYAVDGTVAKLIDIGYEAPAGQMYSSADDLSTLMMFIMNGMLGPPGQSNQSLKVLYETLDSETLREWMQPAYMYHDGTGFGRPWELVPAGNYTLRTKGGAINGYEAEFLMAPEIKTGVVIMKSCLGCPSFVNLTELGVSMITTLSEHLSDTDLLPPSNQPPNTHEYVGEYVSRSDIPPYPETTFVVTVGDLNGQAVLIGQQQRFSVRLEWKPDLGKDVFQISSRGLSLPCSFMSRGMLGEYAEFLRSGQTEEITGMSINGLLPGTVFNKK